MIRNTIQRSVVFNTVNQLKNHATADEIYLMIHKEHPSISKGTVYRNLQKLCDEGKIKKRQIPGESDRFDHICSDHYHGKCIQCGCIIDLDMDYMHDLQKRIHKTDGFEVLGHDIVFTGICSECKKKDKNP